MSGIFHKFLNLNLMSSSADSFRSSVGGYWTPDNTDETAVTYQFTSLGDGSSVQSFRGFDGGRYVDTEFVERIVTDISLATTSSNELAIPSIKFPVRIIGNEDNIDADEEWLAVVAGGTYGTSSYGGILGYGNFLDINFTYEAPYAPIYVKENDQDNIGNYTLANFTYDYNSYIEEYQEFANGIPDVRLLPNYYFLLSHQLGLADLENEAVNAFVSLDPDFNTRTIFKAVSSEYPPTYDIDSSDINPTDLTFFDKKRRIEVYLSSSFVNFASSSNETISNLSSNLFFNKKSQENLFLESLDFSELMPFYTKINLPYEESTDTTFFDMIESSDTENIMLNYIKNYFVDDRQNISKTVNFDTFINKLTSSNFAASETTIMSSSVLNYADFYDVAFNSIIEANNTKQDNFYILGGQNEAREQLINNDGLYRYKNSISGLKLLEQINNFVMTDSLFTSDIENIEDFLNLSNTERYAETMAYRIEKIPSNDPTNIQNFYISNTQTALRSTSNRDGVTIYDTQVKYDEPYTYNAYAYVLVYGYAYKYSDLVTTRQIATKDITTDGEDDVAYCLEFFNPATGETSNRLVLNDDALFLVDRTETVEYEVIDDPISGATFRVEELATALLESYLDAGQEIYTVTEEVLVDEGILNVDLLTTAQLASYNKFLADFNFSIEPTIKLVEVPIFTKTISVLDHPPVMLDITPFQEFNDSQIIGFLANSDAFVQMPAPVTTTGYFDVNNTLRFDYRSRYLVSNDLIETDLVSHPSLSKPRFLQVFRKSEMPRNENDISFEDLRQTIDLGLGNSKFTLTNSIFQEEVATNIKYYYLLRLVSANGVNGFATRFIEAELVNDGGYKYSLFKELIESDYPVENEKDAKLGDLKKVFELVPNINQIQFDTSNVDFTRPAELERDNIVVGTKEDSIFDKTFKIRLTSKKTGKMIDLNVTYKLKDGS